MNVHGLLPAACSGEFDPLVEASRTCLVKHVPLASISKSCLSQTMACTPNRSGHPDTRSQVAGLASGLSFADLSVQAYVSASTGRTSNCDLLLAGCGKVNKWGILDKNASD